MNEQAPAKTEQAQRKAPAPLTMGGGMNAIVPQDIDQAYRLATIIVHADMAPKGYDRDANKVMVGILHGMELGLKPMAALQSIAVINGMPSVWGDGALALVKESGLLESFKETLEGEGDEMKAVCVARRRGEVEEYRNEFSMADAKQAGLANKSGPWTNYPKRMLKMRARSWTLRDGFADVLRGLSVAEEAMDVHELSPNADGSYAPSQRPKRSDYADASEEPEGDNKRAAAADPEPEVEYLYDLTDEIGEVKFENLGPGDFVSNYCDRIKRLTTSDDVDTFIENNESSVLEIVENALVDDGAAILAEAQQKARDRVAPEEEPDEAEEAASEPETVAEDAPSAWAVHFPSGAKRSTQFTAYIGECRKMLDTCKTGDDFTAFLEANGAQMEGAAKTHNIGQLSEMLDEARANAE